ncbi:hypothetical protein TNCV_5055831 [Trichonephila clavipes]|nr:hypothetical protein TNCV_5055831 [Trichonephila clavipes]
MTDHVILNPGQVTWKAPELAPPLLTTTPHQREDVPALDIFNVHRCPTRESVPKSVEIVNLNKEVVTFIREINLEVDSDDVQGLLDSYHQELIIDELIEMNE